MIERNVELGDHSEDMGPHVAQRLRELADQIERTLERLRRLWI